MTHSIDALQWPLVAVADFDFADVANGASVNVAFIPDGAIVTGVSTHCDVAFDQDIEVKLPDGTYIDTLKVVADGPASNIPKRVASGGFMTVATDPAALADATTGHAYVCVQYVVPGRANETSHG